MPILTVPWETTQLKGKGCISQFIKGETTRRAKSVLPVQGPPALGDLHRDEDGAIMGFSRLLTQEAASLQIIYNCSGSKM